MKHTLRLLLAICGLVTTTAAIGARETAIPSTSVESTSQNPVTQERSEPQGRSVPRSRVGNVTPGAQLAPMVSLSIRTGQTGEHVGTGDALIIHAADELEFNWSSPVKPEGLKWKVIKKNKLTAGQNPDTAQGVAEGMVDVSKNSFVIDFRKFAEEYPPQAPNSLDYWVYLWPVNAQMNSAGKADSVHITYKAKDGFIVDTEVTYSCPNGHTIVGSDGSKSECSPYNCQGNTCRTSCASINDCAEPFICDMHNRCAPRSTH